LSLRAAVRAAIGALPRTAQELAEDLAVAGRELTAAEIAALDLPDRAEAERYVLNTGLIRRVGRGLKPSGYPDFPMPQKLRTDRSQGRVTISCQISDIDVAWQLAETAPAPPLRYVSSCRRSKHIDSRVSAR
jgi:hypothetical protein